MVGGLFTGTDGGTCRRREATRAGVTPVSGGGGGPPGEVDVAQCVEGKYLECYHNWRQANSCTANEDFLPLFLWDPDK